jgi:hypothetical protein
MTSVLKIKALKLFVATTDVQWCIFQAAVKSEDVICHKNHIMKISCQWESVRKNDKLIINVRNVIFDMDCCQH